MRHRLHPHVRQSRSLRGVTPGTLVQAARIAVPMIGAVAVWAYRQGPMGNDDAVRLALALGVAALLAAPHKRGAELLGAVAIWMTTCEFLAASHTGQFALWRWAMVLASLALIQIVTRLPHLRARARINPWRVLHDTDPRETDPRDTDQVWTRLAVIEGSARPVARRSSRAQ
jgi:hypothetical protein